MTKQAMIEEMKALAKKMHPLERIVATTMIYVADSQTDARVADNLFDLRKRVA